MSCFLHVHQEMVTKVEYKHKGGFRAATFVFGKSTQACMLMLLTMF